MATMLAQLDPQEPGVTGLEAATALPDYSGWHGPGIPGQRAVSGSLIRAGLAVPEERNPDHYLADIRSLWIPDSEHLGLASKDVARANERARLLASYRQALPNGPGSRH